MLSIFISVDNIINSGEVISLYGLFVRIQTSVEEEVVGTLMEAETILNLRILKKKTHNKIVNTHSGKCLLEYSK